MQLTGKSSIRGAITAMTATLLGSGTALATGDSHLESSILLYSETNRVQAAEGVINLNHSLTNGRFLNARLTLDGLTGSSPNGATPSSHIQTFTRPSGQGTYTIKPGEIPMDNAFKDARISVDGSMIQPLNRMTSLAYGGHLSAEQDYTSLGANVGLTRDFNRKNTTVSLSAAFSYDLVSPLGGAPMPLTQTISASEGDGEDEGNEGGAGKGKNVFDAVFGVTQVLTRKTILRLNYTFNHSSGYLNDPYKILSVVQGSSATEPGEPVGYVYESRPDSRMSQAYYAEVRHYIAGHTIDLSYRYFWDGWGIVSHTVDMHYRFPLGAGHALQPHFRWYDQSQADFYQAFLIDGSPLPTNASADYRLAPFHAITVGLQYLFPVAPDAHLSIGAEYYQQAGDLSPPLITGALSQYDIFPRMDAIMIRLGYIRDF